MNLDKLKKDLFKRNIKEGNIDKEGNPIPKFDEHTNQYFTMGLVLCQGCLKTFYLEGYKKGDIFGLHSNHRECQDKIHILLIKECLKKNENKK
jgi:hypothetical protein